MLSREVLFALWSILGIVTCQDHGANSTAIPTTETSSSEPESSSPFNNLEAKVERCSPDPGANSTFLLTVKAFLDLNEATSCSESKARLVHARWDERKLLHVLEWAIKRLNQKLAQVRFEPSVVFDTCSEISRTSRALLASFVQSQNHNCTSNGVVRKTVHLISSSLGERLRSSLDAFGYSVTTAWLQAPDAWDRSEEVFQVVVALVHRLGWNSFWLVTDPSKDAQHSFQARATVERLCVVAVVDGSNSTLLEESLASPLADDVPNFVFLTPIPRSLLPQKASKEGDSLHRRRINIISLAEELSFDTQTQYQKGIELFYIWRNYSRVPDLMQDLPSLSRSEEPQAFRVAKAATSLAWDAFEDGRLADGLSDSEFFRLVEIEPERVRYELFSPSFSGENETMTHLATFIEHRWQHADERLANITTAAAHSAHLSGSARPFCKMCRCVNLKPILSPQQQQKEDRTLFLVPRMDAALIIFGTIAALSAVVTLIFIAFVLWKACFDILEGSQAMLVLLALSLLLPYAALATFTFEPGNSFTGEILCRARWLAGPLAYATVSSALLARALMIASVDYEGIAGHLSGLNQMSLFVFMCGVQVALCLQEAFSNQSTTFVTRRVIGIEENIVCSSNIAYSSSLFWRHVYVVLVHLSLVALCPFVATSKRNYKDGPLLVLGTAASTLSVLSWLLPCMLLPEESTKKEYLYCFGLLMESMGLFGVIIIPKWTLLSRPLSLRGTSESVSLQQIHDMQNSVSTLTCTSSSGQYNAANGQHSKRLSLQGVTNEATDVDATYERSPNPLSIQQLAYLSDAHEASEYPTYKLDSNTEVDTSIQWENPGRLSVMLPPPPPPKPPNRQRMYVE